MNRRKFVEDIGFLSAGVILGGASLEHVQAATKRIEGLSPEQVATKESFWREIQQSFCVSRSVINLNNAGVCACPRSVVEAVIGYTWEQERVPPHTAFTTLAPRLERVRSDLAHLFGCDSEEISIVGNATEALQTVLLGVELKPGDEVLTTKHDYWAMLDALEQRKLRDDIRVKKIDVPVPPETLDDLASIFERGITSRTKLILVSHPVNLTGQLFPIKRICEMAHGRGIEVLVDGAQSFAQLDYTISDLDCDYFGTSLHKWLMGPKCTGMLYVKRDKIEKLWPLLPPPRELNNDIRKFEALGTQPAFPLAIGDAIAFHNSVGAKRKEERLRFLTRYWAKRLENLPNIRFYTKLDSEMSCAIATVGIEGVDPQKLVQYLWNKHRILVTSPSNRVEELQGIRVSPGLHTTIEELDFFVNVMERVAREGIPK